MNYLNRMYNSKNVSSKTHENVSTKNPNRIAGGLKGQGVDHFVMISEDGLEQRVPSHRYVNSLEEQIKKQRGAINVLERKLARCESAINKLNSLKSIS